MAAPATEPTTAAAMAPLLILLDGVSLNRAARPGEAKPSKGDWAAAFPCALAWN